MTCLRGGPAAGTKLMIGRLRTVTCNDDLYERRSRGNDRIDKNLNVVRRSSRMGSPRLIQLRFVLL